MEGVIFHVQMICVHCDALFHYQSDNETSAYVKKEDNSKWCPACVKKEGNISAFETYRKWKEKQPVISQEDPFGYFVPEEERWPGV